MPGRRQSLAFVAPLLALLLPAVAVAAGPADPASAGPLTQISGPSLFTSCTADSPNLQGGTNYPATEVETWVDVNPVNPMNVVAVWQQDRWSNGGARGLGIGVSFDGGGTWSVSALPWLTLCSGGTYQRASDPWISFAPNGDLHLAALLLDTGFGAAHAMVVSRSTDGGMTWSPPTGLITGASPLVNDKESITADATDPNFVYAVWDRVDIGTGTGPTYFTRSADGGATWEPARVIHDLGTGNQTLGNQVVSLRDGTLVVFFTEIYRAFRFTETYLSALRSHDRGASWEPVTTIVRATSPIAAVAPDTSARVRDGAFLFDVAADPRTGALYAVWQEDAGGVSHYPLVRFVRSVDGGATWSAPIVVNKTPAATTVLDRQAFTPAVHVAGNGTIAITYADFRDNDPQPGSATANFFLWCHPQAADCLRQGGWREVRLTDDPYDIEIAPVANGLFLGDYQGLAAGERDFTALMVQTSPTDRASVFSQRIVFEDRFDPRGPGWWRKQIRRLGQGRASPDIDRPTVLLALSGIRAVHDLFDGVTGLAPLSRALDPGEQDFRARASRHVLVLLLNLFTGRVTPWTRVTAGLTAGDAAADVVRVLGDPASTRAEIEAAGKMAERINDPGE